MNTLVPATTTFGYPSNKVLTDGEKFYCAEEGCNEVGDTFQSISTQHRRSAHPKRSRLMMQPSLGDTLRALADEVDSSSQTTRLQEDVKQWRTRALAAERQLNQLRKIMGGVPSA